MTDECDKNKYAEMAEGWDGILVASSDETTGIADVVWADKGFHDLLAYDDGDLINRRLDDLLPDRVRKFHNKDVAHTIATKEHPTDMNKRGRPIAGVKRNGEMVELHAERFAYEGLGVVRVRAA